MEKIVRKFNSFEEAEKFEIEYWDNASVAEKFETVEVIRATYISMFHPEVDKMEKSVKIRKLGEEE